MSVQINVQASQTALAQSIAQGVAAFNSRYAGQNQLNLQINARNFSQPLGRITSDLADFESALKASNARVLAFGASTAVLGGVVKSFKEIANVTLEVEKSLTDINRVLNLSTSGLQKFSSELFNVSKQTASSFNDASKAALEFSRQGLSTEETLKRTADALTLVRLTGISSTKAVEDLTATINGFSKAGLTTSQVVNKLAAVEQDFAVSAGDLTEALSRTGQAAQEAGVDFDELNALVTTAQQNTARGGAVIGNALKTIFTRLQRTETLDQLEKFNIIVRDVEGNILPAVQILQNFANKYNDLADAQRAQLSEQVAGVYQVNILKGIITDLTGVQSTYSKALERGAQASNEADIANQKLNKTLSALAAQTGVGLQQLANNVGKVTFAPLFEAIVSPINDAVKYINDTLEGEGPGSIFANGLLKGIRNVIAGPGLAVAFAVIAKVAKNTFEDATKALPAILGLTTEAQKRANIEKSIIAILQTQSNLSLALQGQQGNATAQAATVLNYAKLQTAQYQQQLQIAQQLAPLLAAQNVTIGSRGIQVGPKIKAGGHIPAFAEMSERMGAAMGGYKSGKVVKAPKSVGANTYMNSAEEVKYVSGFAQPFINPPANSKAGRKHRQNAINRTGVDPYMASGFIPNFSDKALQAISTDKIKRNVFEKGLDFESDLYTKLDIQEEKPGKGATLDFPPGLLGISRKKDKQSVIKSGVSNQTDYGDAKLSLNYGNITSMISKYLRQNDLDIFRDLSFSDANYAILYKNGPPDKQILNQKRLLPSLIKKNPSLFEQVGDNLLDNRSNYYKLNKKGENTKIELSFFGDRVLDQAMSKGFIPNFAPPTSAIRVPWFKKFGNASFDTIQPTLGISKASDLETFRQINFRSKAKGADKVGDSNLFAPLYEDFVFKALQLVSQPKIKDQLIRGYVLQPGSDQKQSAYDAFLDNVAFEKKGFPKENLSGGSISKNLNDKYERFAKANPSEAAKIKESIMIFNEVGHENQLPSDFGKNFTQLAGTSYSQMVKNSPDLVKALSAETNMLLDRYVKNPAFLPMSAAKGFIPNFASMISSSIKGKGNISAIKTGKNNYEIEGVEVGKKFRGQGLGSQLYGSIAQKIGSGSTIKSVLLPQEQALADYASGKNVPAKAIFPQLSWAKMAKSSKLLVNGKEIAISDFESGIASHKYNASKLDMALIELINSHASGFIPNFNFIKGRNSFQKNWLIETAKKRNLNLNDPNTFSKLAAEFAKTYPNDQGMFGFSKGFIPNFAYKQAVMGLEESMSGNKAIFDTKPFPHIRNSSQPNFASAISDHGGLKNALNDSMRNQEAAGLMSNGFVPNFATVDPNRAFLGSGYASLKDTEQQAFKKLNQELKKLTTDTSLTAAQMKALKESIKRQAVSLYGSTGSNEIITETNKALSDAIKQNIQAQKAARNATAAAAAGAPTNVPRPMPSASSSRVVINTNPAITATPAGFTSNQNANTGFGSGVNRNSIFGRGITAVGNTLNTANKLTSGVGFQIAAPMLAGQVESIIAGNKDRSEMSFGRRFASTGASAALTGASTGALIGSIIPGFGTAIGAAVGAVVGLTGAFFNARSTVDDFSNAMQKAAQRDKETENAVQNYINTVKKLEEGNLSPKEQLKTEKERQKYLAQIPAVVRAGINPQAPLAEVQNTLEDLQEKNEKRQKVRNLEVLGASDLTTEQFDKARQAIVELAMEEKPFKVIAASLTRLDEEARKAFLAKGGGLEANLNASDLFKSLTKQEQENIVEGFRSAFNVNDVMSINRKSRLETALTDSQTLQADIERTKSKVKEPKKSASQIYLEIEKFLINTQSTLKKELSAQEFSDKIQELKDTFSNSLTDGLISPVEMANKEIAQKSTLLTNVYNREVRKSNLDFAESFAKQIRSIPVVGSSPEVMTEVNRVLNMEGGPKLSDLQGLVDYLPSQSLTPDVLQSLETALAKQKEIEGERKENLQRDIEVAKITAKQNQIRKEIAIFEANTASRISSTQAIAQRTLAGKQTKFEIQQAQSESYLGYQPNFYNMGMQQESELRIRYREATTNKNLELMKETQLLNAKTNILEAERLRISTEIEAANKDGNTQLAQNLQKLPLSNKINLDNLDTLKATINAQEKYVNSLAITDKQYASANKALTDLKNLQDDINRGVDKETALLKLRNDEDRRRVRDAKSFSVGLSAGFDQINTERETFANDFGQKIPGLFRDGLVGAMDAALNKADDLESALMGVAASFLREIQGMMLRNIANNIVGSIGSAFSFGQPAAGVEPSFQQRGGVIRAQSGMYISGGRTGDKNPALLEDGEYVLNRNAVKALGGPRAIDNLNFNAFPRFATGGDPGTMSASVSMNEPFERLSMYGREQSPEFQNYVERLREEEAVRERKRAERKALLNQFIGTLISTGVSMGISSAVGAAKNASQAKANLKGAVNTDTGVAISGFSEAKKIVDAGGSVTLANGTLVNSSYFGGEAFTRSSFNQLASSRFSAEGIFPSKSGFSVQGSVPYGTGKNEIASINKTFKSPFDAVKYSRSLPSQFKPKIPIRGRQEGGAIGFNQGGFLPYGSRLTDSIPAYLTGGEYVVNSRAVRKYGVGGLNRINSGVAKFQDGGMVGTEIGSPSNTSNTANNNVSINITVNASGGKVGDQESDSNNEGTEGNAKELSNRIKAVVLDVITTEQRTGGLLDSTKKR